MGNQAFHKDAQLCRLSRFVPGRQWPLAADRAVPDSLQPAARRACENTKQPCRALRENMTGLGGRRAVCQREQTAFSAVSLHLGLCLPTLLSDTASSPASLLPLLSKLFSEEEEDGS